VLRRFDRAAHDWIADARARPQEESLLAVLLGSGALGDAEIRDELLTILIAGHETLALALTWSWQLISTRPEVERALWAEVDRLPTERALSADDLAALPFTRAVLAETLRLYPPLWMIGREATRAVEIGGIPVAPGTLVLLCPYVIHRDSRLFADPERFLPERWLAPEPPALPRGAYLPFGGGGRRCIGEEIAKLEGVLTLATIARRWSLRPVQGPWPLDPRTTLRPAGRTATRVARR
jgi:cytochrome P450